MGSSCCSLCKLISHLKQPYKCIVNCGCYALQTSLVFIAIGVTLVYFFIHEIEGENKFRRGLAISGIIGIAVGTVLLVVGIVILTFYARLFKLYSTNLGELVEPSYKDKCKKYVSNGSPSSNSDTLDRTFTLHSAESGTVTLEAQQNLYPYNPNIPIAMPTAPPSDTLEDIPAVLSPWTPKSNVTETSTDQVNEKTTE